MSTRYVWGKYNRQSNTGYRTRYRQVETKVRPIDVEISMVDGQTYYIGAGYSFSDSTGRYSTTGNTAYTYKRKSGVRRGYGYVATQSGTMYYSQNWYEHASYDGLFAGSNFESSSYESYKYTAQSYQQAYTYYTKGSYLNDVSHASQAQYPSDDSNGSYWYTRKGQDNIDPVSVTIPGSIKADETITITINPSSNNIYGGLIKYEIQYRYNGGNWTGLSTTDSLTESFKVTGDTNNQFEVRVKAQDSMGFVSNDWVTSAAASITHNEPPSTPASITVPKNITGGRDVSITWGNSSDPDGNLSGYILEYTADATGQWVEVYRGPETSATTAAPYGAGKVKYRVKAYDTAGAESAATESEFVVLTYPPLEFASFMQPYAVFMSKPET